MIRVHEDLPIYLVKNFYRPIFSKQIILKDIVSNCQSILPPGVHNHSLKGCKTKFPTVLYNKFLRFSRKHFKYTLRPDNKALCWSYLSTKDKFVEYWHNHLYTSTINAVYYFNIPENDNVTIDFKEKDIEYTYRVNQYDLLIFPNYLMHKPNRCYNPGYRISINMEILCHESSRKLFEDIV